MISNFVSSDNGNRMSDNHNLNPSVPSQQYSNNINMSHDQTSQKPMQTSVNPINNNIGVSGISSMHNSMYSNASMPVNSNSNIHHPNIPLSVSQGQDANQQINMSNMSSYPKQGMNIEGMDMSHNSIQMNGMAGQTQAGQTMNQMNMGAQPAFASDNGMHGISDMNSMTYKNQIQPMNNYVQMPQGNGMMVNMGPNSHLQGTNNGQIQGMNMSQQQYVNMQGNPQGMMSQQMMPGMVMSGLTNNQSNDVGLPRQLLLQNAGVPMANNLGQNMPTSNSSPRMMPQQQMQQMMYSNNMPMQNMSNVQMANQQMQPQMNVATGLNNTKLPKRPWHSQDHQPIRSSMVEKIISLLKQRRPNATEDWHEKLPHMAKRLEEALYGQADTVDQYSDTATLKSRLQQLALSMGGSKQANPVNRGIPNQQIPYQQMPMNGPPMNQQMPGMMQPNASQAGNQYGNPQMNQQMQQMQQGYIMNNQTANGQYPVHNMYQSNMVQNPQQHGMHNQMGYSNQNQLDSSQQLGLVNSSDQSMDPHGQLVQQRQQQYMPHMNQMNSNNPGQMQMQQGMMGQLHGIPQNMNPQMMGMQKQDDRSNLLQEQKAIPGRPGLPQQHVMPNMMGYQHNVNNNMPMNQAAQMNVQMSQQHLMNQQQSYQMPQHLNNNHQQQGAIVQPMMNSNSLQNQQMPLNHQIPSQGIPPHMNHSNMQQVQPGAPQSNVPPQNVPMTTSQGLPGQNPSHTEEHRRQVLKQQQQRLLLLRHASKCPHESGRCSVTPHCANMKILWKHIMGCKDQDCKVAHCVSSRYVLSHYSKCKDQQCPVCGPVREAIRRNYERTKEQLELGNKSVPMQNMGTVQNRMRGQIYENEHDPHGVSGQRKGQYKGQNMANMPHGSDMSNSMVPVPQKPKSIYPLDPISCAIYSFQPDQIEAHFKSIHEGMRLSAAKIKESFLPLIDEILRLPNANSVFGYPVDPVALGLPDYNQIIKLPMDLGTIRKRLETCSYRDVSNLVFDVHLTFNNATLYNAKGSDVHTLAKSLKKEFDTRHKVVMSEIEKSIELSRNHSDACLICGEIKLLYEPPVYYCNGRCGGQRIRRAATFYSNKANNYYWCNQCYNELKENSPIRLPDCTIYKSELIKKKHNEDSEEPWVMCDGPCERWVHQVCGLFNGRRNTGDECHFVCPICITDKKKKSLPTEIIIAPTTKKMKANDLPHCNLSQFLEKRIYERLEIAYKETAAKRNIRVEDVEKCPALFLRQVSCYDKNQHVREGVLERYKPKNYPIEFPCRTKCVILFQNIDGQDVILFGMYVYEYGHKCPQPNQRRVYISYLDSVHYFRPKQYRTLVYHEILISYLDYVKARGFHTAHIWACPPQKGDDYILYVHPPDQKTPRPDKLRNWYQDMLLAAKARGIVLEISDLHTEFMADQTNDATVLPYFEGDYWVNEAEVIIKDLSNPDAGDENTLDEDAGNKSKRKSKSKRTGRLSKQLTLPKAERDPLMAKLSNMIEPMKDTFFVVRLHPKEYADNCAAQRQAELLAETSEGKQGEQETKAQQLQEEALSNNNVASDIPNIPVEETKAVEPEPKIKEEPQTNANSTSNEAEGADDGFSALAAGITMDGDPQNNPEGNTAGQSILLRTSSLGEIGENENGNDSPSVSNDKTADNTSQDGIFKDSVESENTNVKSKKRKADIALGNLSKMPREADNSGSENYTMAESKEDEGNNNNEEAPSEEKTDVIDTKIEDDRVPEISENSAPKEHQAYTGMFSAVPIERDDTEDVDDVQESEHFDTRQSVLNLCQGNHYQFDQLRRAKHTSMMVLYHIHNPDAPKFVPTCSICHKDLLAGIRYRCESCDVDFCQSCFHQNGPRIHPHQLRAIAIASNSQPKKLTKEQLRERQRSIQLHMQLLQHAANCADNVECKSRNCAKMKEFLKHDSTCTIKAAKGCRICTRINNLLQLHARSCRAESCRVPHCTEIREHLRQMELLQQQMDDRRRTMINEKYRHSGVHSSNADD